MLNDSIYQWSSKVYVCLPLEYYNFLIRLFYEAKQSRLLLHLINLDAFNIANNLLLPFTLYESALLNTYTYTYL